MNEKIVDWLATVSMAVIAVCLSAVIVKISWDLVTMPNMFVKKEVATLAPALDQKKVDDMCIKWWFNSNVESNKKRICGK